MKLNYDKSEWDRIPDEVKDLHTQELDFRESNPQRELHKLEMDRRLFITSNFFPEYSWDGTKRKHRIDEPISDDTDDEPDEEIKTSGDGVSASLQEFIDG